MRDYSQISGQSVGQNVGDVERWVSIAAGLGLSLVALSRGGLLQRLLAGAAGASLLSRGFSGYSGMKAAWTGQSSLGQGMREQIERTRFTFAGAPTAARQIDSLETLYLAEAQELRSAEGQFVATLERLWNNLSDQQLQQQLRGYATELRSRCDDLDRILASRGVNPRRHPDQAMQALLSETRKVRQRGRVRESARPLGGSSTFRGVCRSRQGDRRRTDAIGQRHTQSTGTRAACGHPPRGTDSLS
jgi:hypothetical protein